jgi:hypothetical protein
MPCPKSQPSEAEARGSWTPSQPEIHGESLFQKQANNNNNNNPKTTIRKNNLRPNHS